MKRVWPWAWMIGAVLLAGPAAAEDGVSCYNDPFKIANDSYDVAISAGTVVSVTSGTSDVSYEATVSGGGPLPLGCYRGLRLDAEAHLGLVSSAGTIETPENYQSIGLHGELSQRISSRWVTDDGLTSFSSVYVEAGSIGLVRKDDNPARYTSASYVGLGFNVRWLREGKTVALVAASLNEDQRLDGDWQVAASVRASARLPISKLKAVDPRIHVKALRGLMDQTGRGSDTVMQASISFGWSG